MADENKRVRHLYGTTADWAANDLVCGLGEIVIANDAGTYNFKIGDGVSTFASLPYQIVTLETAQEINGVKTMTSDLHIRNQTDTSSYGTIYSNDFLGFHGMHLDSNEANSSIYLIGRDPAGDPLIFSVYQNGGVYFNEHLIADTNGIHANTLARFNQQVLIYQKETDNGGDVSEYYQLDMTDANGGNRLRIDSPFPDSQVIIVARDNVGTAKIFTFEESGLLTVDGVLDYATTTGDTLTTKDYVDAQIASPGTFTAALKIALTNIVAAMDATPAQAAAAQVIIDDL